MDLTMPLLPKPTTDIWNSRFKLAEEFQQVWRKEALEVTELYELAWKIDGVPSGVPITMPSTARAIIDEATDHSDFHPDWIKLHILQAAKPYHRLV